MPVTSVRALASEQQHLKLLPKKKLDKTQLVSNYVMINESTTFIARLLKCHMLLRLLITIP